MERIPGLTHGRVVHYTLAERDGVQPRAVGRVRPAIVVEPWEGTGKCNLQVFLDGTNDTLHAQQSFMLWAPSSDYDESGAPGTWRWPPRA